MQGLIMLVLELLLIVLLVIRILRLLILQLLCLLVLSQVHCALTYYMLLLVSARLLWNYED